MKKLVMAMAIALAAVAAQAEEMIIIGISNVFRAGTYNNINANGYLIYSDTLSQSAAVAAFNSAGASYESTIASSAALATAGYIDEACWAGYAEVSRISEMYVLCFDQDNNNNYMYVSPVATPEGGMLDIYAEDTSTAAAMSASGGYQGAGWYSVATSPVPEPTSGLLMLLGVAGLALKRKRA